MRWRAPSPAEEIRQLSLKLRESEDPFTFARLAELLFGQGRLVEARSLCEQAIARYPTYVRARAVMAQIAEREGNLERAETELRMVLHGEPQNLVCRIALARLLLDRGAPAEAKQHLEYALFLSPGDAAARALLAQTRGPGVESPREVSGLAQLHGVQATPASAMDHALDLVANTAGVISVLLIDDSGLLIDSRGQDSCDPDVASAVVYETWNVAKSHMVRMRLGTLTLASIHAFERLFAFAPCSPGLLAVAAEPHARLGLINRRLEAARNLLVNV